MILSENKLMGEFQYFLNHQVELAGKYGGKYIVIKGEEVLGAYETANDAYFATKETHEPGTFLIQFCDLGVECHTATYFPRITFHV